MFLDYRYATERSCPDARCFDEQSAKNTADSACKDKGCEFEELPVEVVSDLEEDNLLGAIWVEELERQGSRL
jgi:hypothetical protein